MADNYNYNAAYDLPRADENRLDKCRDLFMIGRLREDYPTRATSNGSIQIYVEPLCDDPEAAIDLDKVFNHKGDNYIGFDNQQLDQYLPFTYDPYGYDTDEHREEELEEFYRNKLIIFHPLYTQNTRTGEWFKNLKITNLIDDDKTNYFTFKVVPRVQMDPAKFEQALKKGEYFDLPGYDGEICDPPEIVLCGSYAYRMKRDDAGTDLLEPNSVSWSRWRCVDYANIVKIDMTKIDSYKKSVIRASDNIVFLEGNLHNALLNSTEYEKTEEEKSQIQKIKQESQEKVPAEAVKEVPDSSDDIVETDEVQFLKGLQQLTLNNGLQYKFDDLANFHISVKTNPLTILAGMSGTGKSRLALNYAKMLDLSEDNKNLLFMPISPSYTEPSDVLGYLNSMNGLYVPSETGLVQFLIHAEQNPDQMHMVIFDEMNLSQVEYWFSPFISILEKDPNERILTLYDEDAHCINEKVYPPRIRIGENVIFVGTVNIDDTTKDFSNRLLDRTFVIRLDKVKFTDFYNDYLKHEAEIETIDVTKSKCKSVSQFRSWCHGNDRHYMEAFRDHSQELEFFDALNDLIKKYIPDGGISHRVLKNIGNYFLNVPVSNHQMIIDRKVIFDTVINQTIMNKIRGTETQLLDLIGTMNDDRTGLDNSELVSLLDQYQEISRFTKTKDSLATKAEELRINGYAN